VFTGIKVAAGAVLTVLIIGAVCALAFANTLGDYLQNEIIPNSDMILGAVEQDRPSYVYYTDENGDAPMGLEDIFFYSLPEKDSHKKVIQSVELRGTEFFCSRRFIRKIPIEEDCFEKVWSDYRERMWL
jgi:hypothetical protein